MYAIYGNIYHQYTPNVSIYIPYIDPMCMVTSHVLDPKFPPKSILEFPNTFITSYKYV
jgi:hypothetical protein